VLAITLALALPATLGVAVATAHDPEPPTTTVTVETTTTLPVETRYQGRTAREWQHRYRRRTRQLQAARDHAVHLRRALLHRPEVAEAINLACAVYGWCSALWRKAGCETGGTFSPAARNSSGASGLFQFLPSTWASTPFARFSIWSPYANALAAGWMHANGRGGEWSCR
jgi:hypothetical protein